MATFTISENYGTYQGNTSYIVDGNTQNCWRADATNSSGKYVLITSSDEIYVSTVTYTTTQSSEIFKSGTYLQYSMDGNSFTDVDQFDGTSGKVFSVNANCKYLRIYCKSGSGYVSISELDIQYTSSGSGGGGGGGSSSGEKRTETFTPYSFDSSHSYSSGSNTSNPIGAGSTSTTYAQFYLTTGSGATTYFSYSFDLSKIPANAIIKSVSCQAKAYTNGTNPNRVATRRVQLYSGSTAKGSSYNVAASTTPFSISAGTWTREELKNAKIRFDFVRGTSYTTTNYYVRFYGATLTVEYEIPEEEKTTVFYIQMNNTLYSIDKVYANKNGSVVEIDPTTLSSETNYVLDI